MIKVSGLFHYPLKSVRGLQHVQIVLDKKGVSMDRRWMVVDEKGCFVTQRKHAKMCLVQASLNDEEVLRLSAEGVEASLELSFDQASTGTTTNVEVWGQQVAAQDCGELAAKWWSDYLGKPCRMVFMADDCVRPVYPDSNQSATVSFADRFPLLLISEGSIDFLNQHLSSPVNALRFRPNIVISGCSAFEEDKWQCIRIGNVEFELAEPCARCGIPAINPESGTVEKQVLTVLNQYRRRDKQVYFGQNLIHQSEGVIVHGAPVEILA